MPQCVALHRRDGARGALLDQRLLARLLAERRVVSRVFEERRGDGTAAVRGVGLSGFPAPAVAERILAGQEDDVVERLLASCRTQQPLLLDERAQGRIRVTGSLDMLVLNVVVDDSPDADVTAATAAGHAAFMQAHAGYGLRSLSAEIRPWEGKAASHRAALLAMGCTQLAAPDGGRTRVLALTREHMERQPFHVLQPFFARRTPAIRFTPAQRHLLECAVLGMTDCEAAKELDVTLHTVHKRWRAIFDCVARDFPALLDTRKPARDARVRGSEKRHALVKYLRQHPEALRPWEWPSPGS